MVVGGFGGFTGKHPEFFERKRGTLVVCSDTLSVRGPFHLRKIGCGVGGLGGEGPGGLNGSDSPAERQEPPPKKEKCYSATEILTHTHGP